MEAARRVAAGEPMLSPTVTRQLIAHIAAVDPAPAGPSAGGCPTRRPARSST
jgi:hypothetical protein